MQTLKSIGIGIVGILALLLVIGLTVGKKKEPALSPTAPASPGPSPVDTPPAKPTREPAQEAALLAALKANFCDEKGANCATWLGVVESVEVKEGAAYFSTAFYPKDENKSQAMILATSSCREASQLVFVTVMASDTRVLARASCAKYRPSK
jgi:hypothetical protein